MENFFIIEWFDWQILKTNSKRVAFINAILKRMGVWTRLQAPRVTGISTTVEQRMNLYHFVSQVLAYNVPGDLVDVGCNSGQSSALIQKVVEHYDPSRRLHVYDSFEGLPPPTPQDGATQFQAGMLRTNQDELRKAFETYRLTLPAIHAGWFHETLPTGLPDRICFAHLDGDFYESILVSLQHVYPRLSPGAICVIDDYSDRSVSPEAWDGLPGVKRACDEFLAGKPEKMSFIYSAEMPHGYFRKR